MAKRTQLSAKQQIFVEAILAGETQGRAAIAAGYSRKGADTQANRMLKNAEIRLAINRGVREMTAKYEISKEKIAERLAHWAFSQGVHPAWSTKACELLGKANSMFVERHEHTGRDGAPIEQKVEVVQETPEQREERLKRIAERESRVLTTDE